MFVKVMNSYRTIFAACDKELIGKMFEEGKLQLNLKESFYQGEELEKKEMVDKQNFEYAAKLRENQRDLFPILNTFVEDYFKAFFDSHTIDDLLMEKF